MPEPAAIFARADWQMSLGNRAALEGMLAQLEPGLSIEIGIAQGGSLERIAAHSEEVHAIDLTAELLVERPPNATVHEGDSKLVLPPLLARFAGAGRNVDFALVDGDHAASGVRADLEALLASPAVARTTILVHDSFNPEVRTGIESVDWDAHEKVVGIELDFVPGRMVRAGTFAGQLWDGLALVVVDDAAGRGGMPGPEIANLGFPVERLAFEDAYETIRRASQQLAPRGERIRRELESARSSLAWHLGRVRRSLATRLPRRAPGRPR